MKYSEFNNKYADLELQYTDSNIHIYCDGVMIGKVSKEYRYMMSTHYAGFEELPLPVAVKLFADMAMLAQTQLAEREEEQRYYLRLATKIDVYEDRRYLNMDIPNEKYTLSENKDDAYYKAIFTESEISQMDITGFQKVEVVQ